MPDRRRVRSHQHSQVVPIRQRPSTSTSIEIVRPLRRNLHSRRCSGRLQVRWACLLICIVHHSMQVENVESELPTIVSEYGGPRSPVVVTVFGPGCC